MMSEREEDPLEHLSAWQYDREARFSERVEVNREFTDYLRKIRRKMVPAPPSSGCWTYWRRARRARRRLPPLSSGSER